MFGVSSGSRGGVESSSRELGLYMIKMYCLRLRKCLRINKSYSIKKKKKKPNLPQKLSIPICKVVLKTIVRTWVLLEFKSTAYSMHLTQSSERSKYTEANVILSSQMIFTLKDHSLLTIHKRMVPETRTDTKFCRFKSLI